MQANSQIPITPPLSGAALVDDANDALKTIGTDFSGDIDPAALAWPFSKWADTANGLLKRRNAAGSSWDVIGALSLNPSTDHAGDEPANPIAYMKWADIANGLLKRRSADNTAWQTLMPLLSPVLALNDIVGSDVSTPLNVMAYGTGSSGSWIKFAGGLLVCFGFYSQSSASGTWAYNVGLPAAYGSSTAFVGIAIWSNLSGANYGPVNVGIVSKSQIRLNGTIPSSLTSTSGIFWITVGVN